MKMLLKLFLSFMYIGAFSFGGGYSMLPMFRRVLVQNNGWLTDAEITDYFSVSQCLPGIIAINTAVFVGYRQRKIAGGVAAALGTALPSLVIILLIAALISNFNDYPIVGHALSGIRVCVCVLIAGTVKKLWKRAVVDKLTLIVFISVFLLSVFTNLSAAIIVLAAGVAGAAVTSARNGGTAK